jgi:cytochrome o ubiquinol oxidase subunit 1
MPRVTGRDAYWAQKTLARAKQGHPAPARAYEPIEAPKNTATGFVNAFFAVVTGFALIWHIWWMAALGAFGAFVTFLVFAFRETEEVEISAETIARFDRAHPAEVAL